MPNDDLITRNRRSARAFLDGMEQIDEALIRSGLHDDVVLRLPRPSMIDKTIGGGDNLARFLADLMRASYVDPHASTDMFVIDETHGVAEWRLRATLVNGGSYDQFYCWTFDFADGLVREIREYIDTRYGLEMNGATGQPAIARHA